MKLALCSALCWRFRKVSYYDSLYALQGKFIIKEQSTESTQCGILHESVKCYCKNVVKIKFSGQVSFFFTCRCKHKAFKTGMWVNE
jgi:hypothetical protein